MPYKDPEKMKERQAAWYKETGQAEKRKNDRRLEGEKREEKRKEEEAKREKDRIRKAENRRRQKEREATEQLDMNHKSASSGSDNVSVPAETPAETPAEAPAETPTEAVVTEQDPPRDGVARG